MQGLIQVGFLLRGQRPPPARPNQSSQPGLQKLEVGGGIWKLQRIEACGYTVAQRQVLPTQRPNQDFQASILVEYHLGHTLAVQHVNQKADENSLAGAGRPANEGMTGILRARTLPLRRIARVQGEE